MRLRRLELVFIGLTLAFAVFMGGFFTGRSWSSINIAPVATNSVQSNSTDRVFIQTQSSEESPVSTAASENNTNYEIAKDSAVPRLSVSQEQQSSTETGAKPEAGSPRGGDGRININLATQSELTDLPGIGSVLASRIIDYRRQHGDFLRIEDIRNVSGIGEKRYEAIQDKITVG